MHEKDCEWLDWKRAGCPPLLLERGFQVVSLTRLYITNFEGMTDVLVGYIQESIMKYGLRTPLRVTREGEILDGRHRYRALINIGQLEVMVCVI